jgi:hypothetical protein
MEPDPTVQVPATGPEAAVLAVTVLPGVLVEALAGVLVGDRDSAAGVLPLKKWM